MRTTYIDIAPPTMNEAKEDTTSSTDTWKSRANSTYTAMRRVGSEIDMPDAKVLWNAIERVVDE